MNWELIIAIAVMLAVFPELLRILRWALNQHDEKPKDDISRYELYEALHESHHAHLPTKEDLMRQAGYPVSGRVTSAKPVNVLHTSDPKNPAMNPFVPDHLQTLPKKRGWIR